MSNVREDVIRDGLSSRLSLGRSKPEAAGEHIWITNLQQSSGLLSRQTQGEVIEVIDRWLVEGMSESLAKVSRYVARNFARYLAEHVNIDDYSTLASTQIDLALRAWRNHQ
jgi:hypothetical protein